MNAAFACGIVLALVLILALLTNGAYNKAKRDHPVHEHYPLGENSANET